MAEIKELLAEAKSLKAQKDEKLTAIAEEHKHVKGEYLKALQKRQECVKMNDKKVYNEVKNDVEFYQSRLIALEKEYEKVESEAVSFDDVVIKAFREKNRKEKENYKKMHTLIAKELKNINNDTIKMYSELNELGAILEESGIEFNNSLTRRYRVYEELEYTLKMHNPMLYSLLFFNDVKNK